MSLDPQIKKNTLTYDSFNWKTAVDLIGAGPSKYCHITGPRECRRDRDIPQECQAIFNKCIKDLMRTERYSRIP